MEIFADSQFYREKGLLHVLRLRTSDFDSRGDFEFPLANGDRQVRGGLVYHQPNSNWIRVGLRVRGRYDGGNDDWILMDGNANEWAVGFHGSSEKGTRSISQTRQFKVTGKRQVYSTRTDNNYLSDRKGESCGGGAYFRAKIEGSEPYATYKTQGHKIVIQVRFFKMIAFFSAVLNVQRIFLQKQNSFGERYNNLPGLTSME